MLALVHPLAQIFELQVHDLAGLVLGEALVVDDLVQTVQELGTEFALQQQIDLLAGVLAQLVGALGAALLQVVQDDVTAEVGGQDDDGILEIYEKWIKENPFDEGNGWGSVPWSQKEMPLSKEIISEAEKRNDTAIVIIGRTAGEDQDNRADEGSYYLTQPVTLNTTWICDYNVKLCLNGNDTDSFFGDFGWSAEAITNILKNGIEHMENGGNLYVSWSEKSVYSEIEIEDEGNGISDEELPHIFERFYRGKTARHSGFGIGMAMAQSIFAKQNGTIKAQNREEGGAKFVIHVRK